MHAVFESHAVMPVVAEVVYILEGLARLDGQIPEPYARGVLSFSFGIWLLEVLIADREPVKMVVLPPHRVLDDRMELSECRRARDLQPTPNRRLDFLQRDPKLIDGAADGPGSRVLLGHGAERTVTSRV
jgi:hypothetical protein